MIIPFLETLWGGNDLPGFILIWTLQGHKSTWHKTVKSASSNAMTSAMSGKDVYVGVGLSNRNLGPSKRVESKEVSAVCGIVADLDIAGPGHKAQNGLFTDADDAKDFIDGLPMKPSVIINSGGGLQAWWLYKELLEINSPQENLFAESLAYGWTSYMQQLSNQVDRRIDSMFDLARVMRIPGTNNLKTGQPRLVKTLLLDGPRYNPGDFEDWREIPKIKLSKVPGVTNGAITLNADASPPYDKLHNLLAIEPKFRSVWERRGHSLKDQSASAEDMSLANFAAVYGWSTQEIIDLLITHRRIHGFELKLNRQDYYLNTVEKAKQYASGLTLRQEADKVISKKIESSNKSISNVETSVEVKPPSDADRQKLLELIRRTTGIDVIKLIRHGDTDASYSVVIAGGKDVSVPDVNRLLRWTTWEHLSFEYGAFTPPPPKKDDFMSFKSALKMIMQEEQSEDISEEQVLLGWVRDLASRAPSIPESPVAQELFDILLGDSSFRQQGSVYVRIETLLHHIRSIAHERITRAELLRKIKVMGFERKDICARVGSKIQNRCYWSIKEGRLGAGQIFTIVNNDEGKEEVAH